MRSRVLFGIVTAAVLLALAFGAGYGIYPLLHRVPEGATPSPAADGAADASLGVFWEAWRLLDSNFYGSRPVEETRMRGAVRGMVDSFGDPYTVYVEPQPRELERDRLRGSFGGIGATVEFTDTRFLLHPLEGQPAQRAGVLEGDELRSVDSVTVTASMSSDEVVALIRGPIGTTVTLGLGRIEGDKVTGLVLPVARAEIQTASIEYELLDANNLKIGLLRHAVFSERSAEEMREAIAALVEKGATRFIWDLRGNPGGLVDAAVATADIWLDGGPILIEEHADGSSKVFSATPGGAGVGLPLMVLVDAGSASASEIVAGALQDAGRARLVGERTYGKGSVQLIFELADASSLHVTNAQWFTPNHRQIQGNGLAPDIAVEEGIDPLSVALAAAAENAPTQSALR